MRIATWHPRRREGRMRASIGPHKLLSAQPLHAGSCTIHGPKNRIKCCYNCVLFYAELSSALLMRYIYSGALSELASNQLRSSIAQ